MCQTLHLVREVLQLHRVGLLGLFLHLLEQKLQLVEQFRQVMKLQDVNGRDGRCPRLLLLVKAA